MKINLEDELNTARLEKKLTLLKLQRSIFNSLEALRVNPDFINLVENGIYGMEAQNVLVQLTTPVMPGDLVNDSEKTLQAITFLKEYLGYGIDGRYVEGSVAVKGKYAKTSIPFVEEEMKEL